MENLTEYKKYSEFKAELDGVLKQTVENFVKTGYLLKVARDTNILEESGYKTVAEFAKEEYNLNPTQVSRFISINDRFSEGGYSENLLPEYQGFGYAKLTIMLQLPEYITEELTPNLSKAEVQAVKEEYEEEQKVTDLERMMEDIPSFEQRLADMEEGNQKTLARVIFQLGEDDQAMYCDIAYEKADAEAIKERMAYDGDKIYSVRVRGVGRMMLTITEEGKKITLINTRSGEKAEFTWEDLAEAWKMAGVLEGRDGKDAWQRMYGKTMEIAPVQEEKKESRVVKAPEEKKEEKKETAKNEERADIGRPEDTGKDHSETDGEGRESAEQESAGGDAEEETERDPEPEEKEQEVWMPEPVEETGIIVEGKTMIRREYMETLTEYGIAMYMHKEYLAGKLKADHLVYPAKMEEWLMTKVTEEGQELDDVIEEAVMPGQMTVDDFLQKE